MAIEIKQFTMPARRPLVNNTAPKYDLGALRAGTDDCIVETEVVNIKKAQSRFSSAVNSYRKRTGDTVSRFAVRTIEAEDGTDMVGIWKLANPAPVDAAPAEATPVEA